MKKVDADRRKAISNLMLDLAKLTFASFILGGILLGELSQYLLLIAGAVVSVAFALLGILLAKKE